MKAVILAAGRGKRMNDLTEDIPKPMLTVGGKNLLQWKIDFLPEEIEEVILVVGYLKEKIIDFFGKEYNGKKITYVVMEELNGTASALWLCKEHLQEKFLVLMGDDLYGRKDIRDICKYDWAIGVEPANKNFKAGRIIEENGNLIDVSENGGVPGDLINTGLYVLQPELFNYEMRQIPNGKEFGLPQTLNNLVKDFDIKIVDVKAWIRITSPEDIKIAENRMFL
jgi:NDP-sugar pyrophosphorylase family protein